MTDVTIALAGNPNCGKTALFNALTGSSQRMGNWPGVTVDRHTGQCIHDGQTLAVIDLPGIYSMSVATKGAVDETIACQFLFSDEVDMIVNVIDGSNLERNLFLTLQLLEMKVPMIVAVNMMDIVEQRGVCLDLQLLAKQLGCPVAPIVASRKKGMDQLKDLIFKIAESPYIASLDLALPKPIEKSIRELSVLLANEGVDQSRCSWLSMRLLEADHFAKSHVSQHVSRVAEREIALIEAQFEEDIDTLIADARYQLANKITDCITQLKSTSRRTITQWIDRIVLNRYLGIPIFLMVMYLMFVFAINVGGAFQDFFDIGSTAIFVDGLGQLLRYWHFPVWMIAVLANGLGTGFNTVLTFAPVLGMMFLFLACLEDCGYMARAAFVMDRFMRAVGLPGRSFVPMIVGFGCNVPAVMGARTLASPRDRILTVMMMPFMSCGARLAIFAVFASAFFPVGGAYIIFLLYLIGILVAFLTGFMLRKAVLSGKPTPLVMELPPYHMPQMVTLIRQTWLRLKSFLFRAGKYIVPICVLLGVLNSVTLSGKLDQTGSRQSLLSGVGRVVTPVFAPMGINQHNWPATVGLATGVLAKEVVVGTLNTLYSNLAQQGEDKQEAFNLWGELRDAVLSIPANLATLLSALKNPIAASEAPHDMNRTAFGEMYQRFDGKVGAFAYLLFVLLYFPCVSTMAVIRREVGRSWVYFSVLWSTGLAYSLSVICYQALTVFRHPITSMIWVFCMCVLLMIGVWGVRRYGRDELGFHKPWLLAKLMTK